MRKLHTYLQTEYLCLDIHSKCLEIYKENSTRNLFFSSLVALGFSCIPLFESQLPPCRNLMKDSCSCLRKSSDDGSISFPLFHIYPSHEHCQHWKLFFHWSFHPALPDGRPAYLLAHGPLRHTQTCNQGYLSDDLWRRHWSLALLCWAFPFEKKKCRYI